MMDSSSRLTFLGKRRGFILFTIVLFFLCLNATGVKFEQFALNEYGLKASGQFFKAAFHPSFDYLSDVPESAPPYYYKILNAAWLTIKYATCGFSLAIPIGISMGFFASKSWWDLQSSPLWFRIIIKAVHRASKIIITSGRSIHELLWGLLLISALGTTPLSIIFALAIPYGCTLAKVFSELLDEQDTNSRDQIRLQGSSSFSSWLFGIVPLAFTDLLSYALYRYECAIRSAAVFGFVGIQTIGYHIQTAAADGAKFYPEIWTLLYVLLAIILIIERLSSYARSKLSKPQQSSVVSGDLAELQKNRPKNLYLKVFLLFSLCLFFFVWNHQALLPNVTWLEDSSLQSHLTSEQRWKNFEYFLNEELTPSAVRNTGDWSQIFPWARELFFEKGISASLQTFYIATAAIILAWLSAITFLPWASKALNSPRPFGIYQGNSILHKFSRKCFASFLRFFFILCRAMPEYLLAFLFLIIFPASAWPLILALAVHNFGIIGKLGGELIDNKNFSHSKLQLAQGGSALHSYLFSILPTNFNRLLLYFFYRWETCIRDATVLGMLALASIGFEIQETIARGRLDEMFFFVLLSASIVIIGDIISDIVRSRIRH